MSRQLKITARLLHHINSRKCSIVIFYITIKAYNHDFNQCQQMKGTKKKRINHTTITILFPSLHILGYWTFKYSKFLAPVIEKSIKTGGTPDSTSTGCIRLDLVVLFLMPLLLTWGTSFCQTRSQSFQKFLINKQPVIIGKENSRKCRWLTVPATISYYLYHCQYILNGFNWQQWIFLNHRLWR